MNEVRYDTPPKDVDYSLPSVFLAGPTVRSHQTHLTSWRPNAVALFWAKGFEGNVFIPEFSEGPEAAPYVCDIIEWEFQRLTRCDVIMFWIPRTEELIGLTTNHEHGYWLARDRCKVVYGRPDGAYKTHYLDYMWAKDCKDRHGDATSVPPICRTLEETVNAVLKKLEEKS